MGCSGSKPDGDSSTGNSKATKDVALKMPADGAVPQSLDKVLHSSRERMSISTDQALVSAFSNIDRKRRSSLAESRSLSPVKDSEGSDSFKKAKLHDSEHVMTKEKLRGDKVFCEMPEALFDFMFRIFDPDDTGKVNTDHFVMAVGLIAAASEEGNLEMSIETCFYMFDTGKTGRLSRDEFEAMVQTTIAIKLEYLLQTKEGARVFEAALEKEFSHENFAFWSEARAYAKLADDSRGDIAEQLIERYVKAGAEQQVNLPSKCTNEINARFDAATKARAPPPADLFAASAQEIFLLMERDTHERFKADKEQAKALVEDFFKTADTNSTGEVTFEEYRAWVLKNPHVLVFFHEVFIPPSPSGAPAHTHPRC